MRISEEENPLRVVVQDVYALEGKKTIVGRVESGMLRKGDEVIFEPSRVKGRIEKIKVFDGELKEAMTGDCVGIVI